MALLRIGLFIVRFIPLAAAVNGWETRLAQGPAWNAESIALPGNPPTVFFGKQLTHSRNRHLILLKWIISDRSIMKVYRKQKGRV